MRQGHKQQRFDELKDFIKKNPHIRNFITDYVLCLILTKPENVIEFSEGYFARFLEPAEVDVNVTATGAKK